jgi:hypothetical protein
VRPRCGHSGDRQEFSRGGGTTGQPTLARRETYRLKSQIVTPKAVLARAGALVPADGIRRRILVLREERVMIDSDLATLYGVEVKALNQAVRRNIRRFPEDFMFQLTSEEFEALRSQFVTAKPGRGGRRSPPYAFTEQGVSMLSSVLNSNRAVQVTSRSCAHSCDCGPW